MAEGWARVLTRWTEAGLIDEPTAERIRSYERADDRPASLRWSIWLALAFGALMVGAGALLFVSANWDVISPQARFGLVTMLVAVFHVAGAAVSTRFPKMATALHVVGTVALGAGIFLGGQIFNLDEHWPGGIMLWALGAAIGSALLRDWPQTALLAILAPAWLTSEWFVATDAATFGHSTSQALRIAASGIFLLALAYFGAVDDERDYAAAKPLFRIGQTAVLPAAAVLAVAAMVFRTGVAPASSSAGLLALGWTVAIAVPLAVSVAFRRSAAWPNIVAVAWVLVLNAIGSVPLDTEAYVWWAIGATGLAAWGVREARSERITMGTVIFGGAILAFYFSHVMDKLGRSASLAGFGLLFLAAGWALERVRRRLILEMRGGVA